MRAAARGLLALGLALGWWGGLVPDLVASLQARRAQERVEPQTLALASALASARPSLLPEGAEAARARALLAEASFDLALERAWTLRAGTVLNPAQRADAPPAPERPRARHQPWMDPELPALLAALGEAQGWEAVALPDPPPFDPWPGVEPRRRAERLRALAPTLSPEQAHVIAGLALEATLAASRRAQAEEALRALMDPALVRMAARLPGKEAHVTAALDTLAARSRE